MHVHAEDIDIETGARVPPVHRRTTTTAAAVIALVGAFAVIAITLQSTATPFDDGHPVHLAFKNSATASRQGPQRILLDARSASKGVQQSIGVHGHPTGMAKVRGLDLPEAKRVKDSYIVQLKENVSQDQIATLCASFGQRHNAVHRCARIFRKAMRGVEVSLSPSRLERLVEQFDEVIDFVEVDGIATVSETWGLDRVDQRALPLDDSYGSYYQQGEGVDVLVLDTGLRKTHSEFGGRAFHLWSAYDTHGDDRHGHGTHCSGTIAGATYGVAKRARVYGVKILSDEGAGSWSGIIEGCEKVIEHCAASSRPCVASMSIGGGYSSSLNTAVSAMRDAGITVVVAAGNENDDACSYSPASSSTAITVGATTSSDARSSFSNVGSCVDIFAPGSAITSAVASSDTAIATWSGTSMACPHVSGAAALMLSSDGTMSPDEVKASLLTRSTPGLLSGLTASCPNKLLFIGPTESPTQSPTPAPTNVGDTNPPTTPTPTSTPTFEWVTCANSGAVYTTLHGTLSDGRGRYGNLRSCSWTISTGQEIQLHFTEFSTEWGWDYLKVYDGTSSSAAMLGSFHGSSVPNGVTASSGSMFLEFTSDSSVTNEGFVATWQSAQASTSEPTLDRTAAPSTVATFLPTLSPTWLPTASPTPLATVSPTELPTRIPTLSPTFLPTLSPTSLPTAAPTSHPTPLLTLSPTRLPTSIPSAFVMTEMPSLLPSIMPTVVPTFLPTDTPTPHPTVSPTGLSSAPPTVSPTVVPSITPTLEPSTAPSSDPSFHPTIVMSAYPSFSPTVAPTVTPTINPTTSPSVTPTLQPSAAQSEEPVTPTPTVVKPSAVPSFMPSAAPSIVPTHDPSEQPSAVPSFMPSAAPSIVPTEQPSAEPTLTPSEVPSVEPTHVPTEVPSTLPPTTDSPSHGPTLAPTEVPTQLPTSVPTEAPTALPTDAPTEDPTIEHSSVPTVAPTTAPTMEPTALPSAMPTIASTSTPTEEPSMEPTYQPMTDSPVTLVPETTAPATAVPTSLLPTVLTDTPVTFVPETTAPVTAVPTRRTPVATCASSGTIYTTLSGTVLDGEGYYSNNAVCSWLISTGTRITLTFSQFSTEAAYDHVHVYDGSSSGYLLRVLDGNAIPGPIVATSGSMFIEFSSDFSVTSEGFSATWAADAPTTVPTPAPTRVGDTIPPTTLNPTSVPTFEVATCATSGTTYTRLTGTITDGYAHRYHDDSECSWTISTGSAITLQFTEFHTEQAYDFVTVYDGASIQEGGFLGQFSGSTIPRTVTATSGSMVIFFTSDYSVTQTGFTAMWF